MQFGLEVYNGFSQVYVVFEDNATLWWLKVCKRGFRHCYMIFINHNQDTIIKINPMSNQISIEFIKNTEFDDVIHNLKKDPSKKVCRVFIKAAPLKCAPIMAFTCVEFVKRVIGIHDIKTITPYQLYKKLKRCRKKVLTF